MAKQRKPTLSTEGSYRLPSRELCPAFVGLVLVLSGCVSHPLQTQHVDPAFFGTRVDDGVSSTKAADESLKLAADPTDSDAPSNDSVRQLLGVIGSEAQVAQQLKIVQTALLLSWQQYFSHRAWTAGQQVLIENWRSKVIDILDEEFGWKRIEPSITAIYRHWYTQSDVNALLLFYKSETGQSLLADSPELTVMSEKNARALARISRNRGEIPKDRQFYLDWHGKVNYEDLKALHAFYQTDVGAEIAAVGPLLAKELAVDMSTRAADMQARTQALSEQEFAEIKAAGDH
jgi:hypothetical protein